MSENRFKLAYEKGIEAIFEDLALPPYPRRMTNKEVENLLNEQQTTIQSLKEDNDKLRELIKKYVFGRYVEGSLADLEFKAIAYDDIVRLELSNESEPKVIVSCKQGKKETAKRFCQMFIPFGVYYEIKEVNG